MAEPHFDLTASSLRADLSDARALAEALAVKLGDALPAQTRIQRRGSRLLPRDRRVEQVAVQLGQDAFVLSLGRAGPQATRARTVGGIVIRRDELPLDAWLQALGESLAAEAGRSETARVALERLLS